MFGQHPFQPTLQNFTLVITFARISSLPQSVTASGLFFKKVYLITAGSAVSRQFLAVNLDKPIPVPSN
jgi:hypothetical protein